MATMSRRSSAAIALFRPSRMGLLAPALVGVAGVALLASACGGAPSPAVAQLATTTTSSTPSSTNSSKKGNPTKYASCMRKHGVPQFPDPDSQGRIRISGGQRNGHTFGIDPNSAAFKKAQQSCQSLQPSGGRLSPQQQQAEQQAELKFSACMRSHGVPKFPDPTFTPGGGSKLTIGKSDGIDPNSPQFQAAQKACQKLAPGGPLSGGPGTGKAP